MDQNKISVIGKDDLTPSVKPFFFSLPLFVSLVVHDVCVAGVGRLGLCTALVWDSVGFDVLGVDVAQPYVEKVRGGLFVKCVFLNPIHHWPPDQQPHP